MRRVVMVESPYSGLGTEAIRYLACCLLDSILRGEAPVASHGMYPLALPEHVPGEGYDWPCTEDGRRKSGREIEKECHGALMSLHRVEPSGDLEPIPIVAYVDTGESSGMRWPSSARWLSTNEPRGSEASRAVSAGLNSRCICQLFRVHLGSPETVDDVALRELVNHEPPLVTIGELGRPRLTEDGLRAVGDLAAVFERAI
jgi:hypothetical protein